MLKNKNTTSVNVAEPLGSSVIIPVDKREGKASVVYFTRDLSPKGLEKIYKKVNKNMKDKVAIKLHTGEKNGPNIIPSDWVKYLVEKQGINPEQILIISFTNKAVNELRDKINMGLNISCPIATFHSTGNAILHKNSSE